MLEKIKSFKWGYILLALVLSVIGVCFISLSEIALEYLAITIGVILCVFATVFTVLAIADKRRGVGFALKIIFAVTALLSGIVTIVSKANAIDIIVAIFALILIIDSSFKLNTSAMSKRYHVVGWWLIMSVAAIGIAASFYLIKYIDIPKEFVAADLAPYSRMLGSVMLLNALNNVFSAFYTTFFERNMKDELTLFEREKLVSSSEEIAALQGEKNDY